MKTASSFACCGCCRPTLATRWIAFFGLTLSTALTTVLICDKRAHNFNRSRSVAGVLGLDWHHTHSPDHDGKFISAILVFYSTSYLIINMALLFASITEKRFCVIPWIAFEVFSCMSKLYAMFYHWYFEHIHYSIEFYIGSCLYIIIVLWWMCVVHLAQKSWAFQGEVSLSTQNKSEIPHITLDHFDQPSIAINGDSTFIISEGRFAYYPTRMQSLEIDCPSYVPNTHYCPI